MYKIEKDIIDYLYNKIKEAAPYIQEITKDRKELTYKYNLKEERSITTLTPIPLHKSIFYPIQKFLETLDVKNKITELEYGVMESCLKQDVDCGVYIAYNHNEKREVCVIPYYFFLYPLEEAIERYREVIRIEQQEYEEKVKEEQQPEDTFFKDYKKELRYREYLRLKKIFKRKEIK